MGLDHLPLEDRATIANMAPEYGATCGFFPVDKETLAYLEATARKDSRIALVEAYAKAQGLYRKEATPDPEFTATVSLDLGDVVPSIAGPKRPQDRVPLDRAAPAFAEVLEKEYGKGAEANKRVPVAGKNFDLGHGDVVIAAITSCTNTSNPYVMVGARRAGAQRDRKRSDREAVGEDIARAGLASRDRLSREGRSPGRSR